MIPSCSYDREPPGNARTENTWGVARIASRRSCLQGCLGLIPSMRATRAAPSSATKRRRRLDVRSLHHPRTTPGSDYRASSGFTLGRPWSSKRSLRGEAFSSPSQDSMSSWSNRAGVQAVRSSGAGMACTLVGAGILAGTGAHPLEITRSTEAATQHEVLVLITAVRLFAKAATMLSVTRDEAGELVGSGVAGPSTSLPVPSRSRRARSSPPEHSRSCRYAPSVPSSSSRFYPAP
jgi:hypothetical protein